MCSVSGGRCCLEIVMAGFSCLPASVTVSGTLIPLAEASPHLPRVGPLIRTPHSLLTPEALLPVIHPRMCFHMIHVRLGHVVIGGKQTLESEKLNSGGDLEPSGHTPGIRSFLISTEEIILTPHKVAKGRGKAVHSTHCSKP